MYCCCSTLQVRKIQRWDSKKKNYVTDQVGGDPWKKLRDDVSGERVVREAKRDVYTGKVIKKPTTSSSSYKEWKKRAGSKRNHNVDDDSNDDSNAPGNAQRGKPTFGHTGKRGRGSASNDAKDRDAFFKKQRTLADKHGKHELRGVDDIRKLRKTKEQNRLRNRKGGLAGMARGSKSGSKSRGALFAGRGGGRASRDGSSRGGRGRR